MQRRSGHGSLGATVTPTPSRLVNRPSSYRIARPTKSPKWGQIPQVILTSYR